MTKLQPTQPRFYDVREPGPLAPAPQSEPNTGTTSPSTKLFIAGGISAVVAVIAFIVVAAGQDDRERDYRTSVAVKTWADNNGLGGSDPTKLVANYVPAILFAIVAAVLITWGMILSAGRK